jgi:hypothetical protein
MGLFAQPGPWYDLNPDYRKDAPNTGLHCCRCQRRLERSYLSVEVNYDTMQVRTNIFGNAVIVNDCWKTVIEESETD